MKRWQLTAFVAVAALSLATACSSKSSTEEKVFRAVPWSGAEHLEYRILDQGGALYGTCVLDTKPGVAPGRTQLDHLCGSTGPQRDDRTVVVDSTTLLPVSSTRTISDPSQDKRTTFTSTYDPGAYTVYFKADENGKVHQTQRELPKPSKDSPDPGYYDDEELFWVMRGVPLQKGFQGSYIDVNASTGEVITVTVRVEDTDSVKVPAGEIAAWRVSLQTQSVTQYFWIDQTAPHEVVQANIESVTYQLTSQG